MPESAPKPPERLISRGDLHAAPRVDADVCVVGIGASAGGLEACRLLLAALPPAPGIAFILVQHMDPTHDSMLVDLLAGITAMQIQQAADGMVLQADHLYVIPPGAYLALSAGILHLSKPTAHHGARLPFDFLLHALAASAGARAVCVILSGGGADGAVGLRAIKAAGGLVIVQEPTEATYDGMPRSAIATGEADFVLPAAQIASKILEYRKQLESPQARDGLARIVAILRATTPHDFTLYKPGTLERRIARRMAVAGVSGNDPQAYIAILESDESERQALAEDLLINVTSFFRDPKVFELLQSSLIPALIDGAGETPLRIWIAGCSTGEETYSLAMLFEEQIKAKNAKTVLQIFASDVDPGAVAVAREGVYPAGIEANVSPDRLAEFFTEHEQGYRVSQKLRGNIVFAVQDVLADPPFSKLDLVSCRNLLIYLRPEAQTKILSIFSFALRPNGILLLGSAETVSGSDTRFDVVSKSARIYRKTSRGAAGYPTFSIGGAEGLRVVARSSAGRAPARPVDIAEFYKKLVLDIYAPASILINHRFECLYSSGPTELYLRVAPGYPTHDFLAMIRPPLRARVKLAMSEATQDNTRVIVPGGRVLRDGESRLFNIDVQSVICDGEKLLLISFIDQRAADPVLAGAQPMPNDEARQSELEQELAATRSELEITLRSLEISTQEQNAIHEEALSVNEEYQSTNEELLTSKEELQSLNEELTALNSQLQETLERSRMTSNDLQNVLYSTDVATLFLDKALKIRFFTPATRSLFTVIASDVGRPLADLHSLAADSTLAADAHAVLADSVPIEREVEAEDARWFSRRILPYRTHDGTVGGVVITFTDITQRETIKSALKAAQRDSERANMAKSRFLAAASHDLRQPLQTLALLNGLLTKIVDAEPAKKLLAKLDDTTNAMAGILNTLLDINQIDAGIVHSHIASFPIDRLLHKLGDEFSYLAESRGLRMHVVPCGLNVYTDPAILEQMIRNLLSNALKYTVKGGVLLGCRRRGKMLSVQIWDTGLGIPQAELAAIFDEYHQLDNVARERSRGLGLGLSIVRRLGDLLAHPVSVSSVHGKGSVFSISMPISEERAVAPALPAVTHVVTDGARQGQILIIEDDPDIRQLLEMFLAEEGHRVAVAPDGETALELVAAGTITPDLIIADYNLPREMNGLQATSQLRKKLGRAVPVIIVTGDISAETLRSISRNDCLQLNKPMKLVELNQAIQRLLQAAGPAAPRPPAPPAVAPGRKRTVFVIDDDARIRELIRTLFEAGGNNVECFVDCEAFLAVPRLYQDACLLLDACLPGMSGVGLLQKLSTSRASLPVIMITGLGDIKIAVQAMKAGAFDFIEKPVRPAELLACVQKAFEQSRDADTLLAARGTAASQLASLTDRQRQILDMVLAGKASKNIAADLGISQRTVENHRASIMLKTGAKSIPALARMAIAADAG
jgi:two-component system CheB/CheR fusion protein